MNRSVAVLTVAAALAAAAPAHAARPIVVGPGSSIQAAVDAAQPGTTIVVTGAHAENVATTPPGLKLRGLNATLTRPATPQNNACFPLSAPDLNGFCVLGDVDPSTFEVINPVAGVEIRGFHISGFTDGIMAFGAKNATFRNNVATDNDEYGITAFSSSGTKMLNNVASDAGESAFYIGDSPDAAVLVRGNTATNSLFGILVRDARGGTIKRNTVRGNCDGIIFLGDSPG